MIKNIIFDLGNVLIDFRWAEFLHEKGFEGEVFERIAKASVLGKYWGEFDRSEWSDEEVIDAFVSSEPELADEIHYAFDDVQGIVSMRDYTVGCIKALKEKGYGVYYLSNYSRKVHVQCKHTLDFLELMDGGILSYQDKVIKPEPEIYELLLKRYGLIAEECVFLDDTPVNVDAAVKLGFNGIRFENIQQGMEELRKMGVDAPEIV